MSLFEVNKIIRLEEVNSELIEALKDAERLIVAVFNAGCPQARNGESNNFADNEPIVIKIRSIIEREEIKRKNKEF